MERLTSRRLFQAGAKTDKPGKEKGRLGPGGIKRAVSLTELQPDALGKAEQEDGTSMGRQSSASRRLLQRLTFSTPAVADKVMVTPYYRNAA